MLWQYAVLFALSVIMLYCIYILFNVLVKNHAPFISTRRSIIEKIIPEIHITQNSRVIEIGCGSAEFLRTLRKANPVSELIGLERYFWPYFIAIIKNRIYRAGVKLVKTDFLKYDLSKADLIYCFLNTTAMRALTPKIKNECRKGTVLISYCFTLPEAVPDKIIKVSGIGEKVYFYTI